MRAARTPLLAVWVTEPVLISGRVSKRVGLFPPRSQSGRSTTLRGPNTSSPRQVVQEQAHAIIGLCFAICFWGKPMVWNIPHKPQHRNYDVQHIERVQTRHMWVPQMLGSPSAAARVVWRRLCSESLSYSRTFFMSRFSKHCYLRSFTPKSPGM